MLIRKSGVLNKCLLLCNKSSMPLSCVYANWPITIKIWFQFLITSSSHVFHESWIYDFFSQDFMFNSFGGLQRVFFCHDKTVLSAFLITIENFCLVEKQNKENFVKKIRRFRNRENMWWAWPWPMDILRQQSKVKCPTSLPLSIIDAKSEIKPYC